MPTEKTITTEFYHTAECNSRRGSQYPCDCSKPKKTQNHVCGWCGSHYGSQGSLAEHQDECQNMIDEMEKDFRRDEQRRLENQLWEEEHEAGRI